MPATLIHVPSKAVPFSVEDAKPALRLVRLVEGYMSTARADAQRERRWVRANAERMPAEVYMG